MDKYLQCWISAEDKDEADKIMNALLKKRLVAGGLITNGPARFRWKKEIVDTDYFNISVFTRGDKKEEIIEEVGRVSREEVPMVWFVEFEGNEELLGWIDESLM